MAGAGAPAPVFDHPVVVGLYTQEGQVHVGPVEEQLPAEAGDGRETQTRLGVVELHVGQPVRLVEATRQHVVVRHGCGGDSVGERTDRRKVAAEW